MILMQATSATSHVSYMPHCEGIIASNQHYEVIHVTILCDYDIACLYILYFVSLVIVICQFIYHFQ
jgi:hypothetical protein